MWHAALIGLGLLGQPPETDSPATTEVTGSTFDCGPNALYLLLRSSGIDVRMEAIERALPPRHSDGYSMAELRDAARACGLSLRGIRIGPDDVPLDRPVIAHMDQGRSGHYVLLRPIGRTGTMVQVIEPPVAPGPDAC